MSALAEIHNDSIRLQFAAPWDLEAHQLFIRSKKLPEAKCAFDRRSDSYTITAPARFAHLVGLEPPQLSVVPLPLAKHLFDYQQFIVQRALEARRYAIWADCGLGKTPMAIEWARQVSARTSNGRVLILCPKNLIRQWQDECHKFYGLQLTLLRLETRDALAQWCKGELDVNPFAITNYEKLIPGSIDEIRHLPGVVLDESSILKSRDGKIRKSLVSSCKGVEFKLSLTATPAPNDTEEYMQQAKFLETSQNDNVFIGGFFSRGKDGQTMYLRPHAKEAFYRFMSSWSIYFRKPSAYGFQDRFDLPEPEIIEHKLPMTAEQGREYAKHAVSNGQLLVDKMGITARSKLSQLAKGFVYAKGAETKRIESEKPGYVAGLVLDALKQNRQVLVWTVFDEESEIIMECLRTANASGVESLHGKDSDNARDEKLEGFRTGKIRALVSKAKLLGWGMNFQFCSVMIFSGFNDSFEQFYQAVRRAHRYGATERLKVYIPYIPELEEAMWNNLLRKKGQWESDIAQQEVNYVTALKGFVVKE